MADIPLLFHHYKSLYFLINIGSMNFPAVIIFINKINEKSRHYLSQNM